METNPTDWAWSQIQEKDLSPAEGLVLLAIARRVNVEHEGICWPGAVDIHVRANLDYRYVRRLIKVLETEHGLFTIVPCTWSSGTRTSNIYVLNIPRDKPPSELLKLIRKARPNTTFHEILILPGGKTLHFGERPVTGGDLGLGTQVGGSVDPGLGTQVGGSVDPGLGTQVGGSIDPEGPGSGDPGMELLIKKRKKAALKDGSSSSVPPVSKSERTKFQKFWGPVEGKLRKEIEPDTFAALYAGIRIVDLNASQVVLAVPPSLLRISKTIEAATANLKAKIESTQTGLLRGRSLSLVSLESKEKAS